MSSSSSSSSGTVARVEVTAPDADVTFQTHDFGLDRRITKAIGRSGFVRPTLVQSKFVPLALKGKDICTRARTGSGKTLAFAIPIVQKMLRGAASRGGGGAAAAAGGGASAGSGGVRALILVPSKELCHQVYQVLRELVYYCADRVTLSYLGEQSFEVQRMHLAKQPNVLVATPASVVQHLQRGNLAIKATLEMLVIDEADLILSFGYKRDIDTIVESLPRICQTFLMSATLNEDVDSLRKVVLHKPVVLKLEDAGHGVEGRLNQFYVELPASDKELLLYALLKLNLCTGKTIFFVNDIERCYRLKLTLEQFCVRASVLNAELPANSRRHILQQFNRGVFDYLIVTDQGLDAIDQRGGDSGDDDSDDDSNDDSDDDSDDSDGSGEGQGAGAKAAKPATAGSGDDSDGDSDAAVESGPAPRPDESGKGTKAAATAKGKKGGKSKVDSEFDAARGIDFQGVKNVINFDFPADERSYTHRIGRTARGGASGTALSLVVKDDPTQTAVLAAVQKSQPLSNGEQQPQRLPLDMREVESLRYRVADICRAVTTVAVKEARLAELRHEILNSKQLQSHFEDNPEDAKVLRHDEHLRPAAVRRHMATVPDYLIPAGLRATSNVSKHKKRRQQQQRRRQQQKHKQENKGKKGEDPLQSFALTAGKLDGSADDSGAKVAKRDPDAPTYALGRSTAGRNKWKQRHGKGAWKGKGKGGQQKKGKASGSAGGARKRQRLPGEA